MNDLLRLAYDIVRRHGYADGGFPTSQDDEKHATRLAREIFGDASEAFGPGIGPNYSGEQFGPPMPSFSSSSSFSPSPSAGKTNEPVETIGRSDFLPGIGKSPAIETFDLPAPSSRAASPQPEIAQPTTNPSPSAGVFSFGPQTGQAPAGFAPGSAIPGFSSAIPGFEQQSPSAATLSTGFANPAASYGSTLGSNIMGAKEAVNMDEYNQNIAGNLIDTHTVNAAPAQTGAVIPGLEQQASALLEALEAQNSPQGTPQGAPQTTSSGFNLSGYSAPNGFDATNAPGVGYVGPTSMQDYTQNTSNLASSYAAPQADPDVAAQQKSDAFEAMIAAQDAQLGLDPTSPGSPAATAAEQAAAAQAAQDALSQESDPETGLTGPGGGGGYGPGGGDPNSGGPGVGGGEYDGSGSYDGYGGGWEGGGDPGVGGGGGEPERRGGRIYARGGYADGGTIYDPMGNVTMPPEEGFAPSPMYEKAMDAIAKSGAAVGSPITSALQTAADVYSDKSREAAAENEALRQQAMRNMQGELGYAGMPLGAGQMLLSQLGTATQPLTAAAKTIGHAATQATGNPRFGENVEFLSGFVDPSHVGMLKAVAPMAGAAAARQAVQTARELSPLGLYSHGAEAAAALQQAKGSPEQIIAQLRSAGVRPAELFSTGIADEAATNALRTKIESEMSPRIAQAEEALKSLTPGTKEFKDAERQLNNLNGTMRSEMDRALVVAPDWASRPSVTREEIAQHLREQMPVVEERVLGGVQPIETDEAIRQFHDISPEVWADMPFRQYEKLRDEFMRSEGAREPTRFDIYNLPGGENYREIALTIPGEERYRVPEEHSMGEGADVNRVAHLRLLDRTGPNGEKILHVEEMQSDWGQQGRKEGFKDPNFAKWRAERDKLDAQWRESTEQYKTLKQEIEPPVDFRFEAGKMSPREYERQLDALELAREKRVESDPRMQELARRRNDLTIKFGQLGLAPSNAGVARGPYVTSTEGWTDLALKRVLKEAAEGGYDKVVFTPGAEQAKRYSLSEHVKGLAYDPEEKTLSFVPKGSDGRGWKDYHESVEPEKLASVIGKEAAEKLLATKPNQLSGNHILENEDLKIGGRGMEEYYDKMVPKRLQELVRRHDKGAKVGYIEGALPEDIAAPGITITPKMRESILRGQPHMAEGGAVDGSDNFVQRALERATQWGYRTGGSVSHQAMIIAKDSARRPAAL